MKKKLLSLFFLVVFICFSISISNSIVHASETKKVINEYYNNVNRSIELYEQVVEPYVFQTAKFESKEFAVYSDEYAGVFIDEQGLLNIAIVGESQNKIKQTKSRYNKEIIYKYFAFSYNYLQKIMNEVELIMNDYSIYTVGIDDQLNHVFIELNDEKDVEHIILHLQVKNLYNQMALNFIVEPNGKVQKTAKTAYGGESLYRYSSASMISRGTICVNAIDNETGKLGILTNEHVALASQSPSPNMIYGGHFTDVGGSAIFSDYASIGGGAKGQQGGNIDAAFIPFSNQENWSITPPLNLVIVEALSILMMEQTYI